MNNITNTESLTFNLSQIKELPQQLLEKYGVEVQETIKKIKGLIKSYTPYYSECELIYTYSGDKDGARHKFTLRNSHNSGWDFEEFNKFLFREDYKLWFPEIQSDLKDAEGDYILKLKNKDARVVIQERDTALMHAYRTNPETLDFLRFLLGELASGSSDPFVPSNIDSVD